MPDSPSTIFFVVIALPLFMVTLGLPLLIIILDAVLGLAAKKRQNQTDRL